MNLSLEGRNAIICGSSQGIGYAIAEELAVMGANCILLARNEDNLRIASSQLDTALRQTHTYHVIDFKNIDQTKQLINDITAQQNIHVLINNSGGPLSGPIIDAKEEEFLAAFNQHLVTFHILTKAVINGMKEDGYGRVINIISTSVKIPLKNLGVSNTIRGAVASWAKTMANELGEFNITVNNVLPGFTKTERLDAIVEDVSHKKNMPSEEVQKAMIQEVPMKRFGEANEVAAVAAFLASPAASYVNGASITVDGGRTGSI
jgi:3-oxoacyl-[acyl-carrier protein] reductase